MDSKSILQPASTVAPLPQLEDQSAQAKTSTRFALIFSIASIVCALIPIIGLVFGIVGYVFTLRAIRENGAVTGVHYTAFVMAICGCLIGGAWFLAAVLFLKTVLG